MTDRRYSNYTDVAAPTIEARRQPPSEREPVHVKAAVMEHVVMGLAWAGVVGAVGVAVRTVQTGLQYWSGVGVFALVVGACVICYMATWHYSQDERLRGRDLRAWKELEADYAAAEMERREALADNGRLREQLRIATMPVGGKHAARPPEPAAEPVDEHRRAYEAASREIARRFELGLAYDRETIVNADLMRPALWNQIMGDAKRMGVVQARGQGGRLTITVYRADDFLRALSVD